MKKAILYINQFFAQKGGEDMASAVPGSLNPSDLPISKALNSLMAEFEIVSVIYCGDNYFNENKSKALTDIAALVEGVDYDMVIAGPAFNAGRYGMACGSICEYFIENKGKKALTAMYYENPAAEIYRKKIDIVKTGKSAAKMKAALKNLAMTADATVNGSEVPKDILLLKGKRQNVFREKNGAERAVDMLLAKINGIPFESEIPIPSYDKVKRAEPISNLKAATIALISTGGIVPIGNPDKLPAATAKFYKTYDIKDTGLKSGAYESVHAGYDPVYANEDPNRIAPLDALKDMKDRGIFGSLYPKMVITTGNSTSVASAKAMGEDIAASLKTSGVQGAIVTST